MNELNAKIKNIELNLKDYLPSAPLNSLTGQGLILKILTGSYTEKDVLNAFNEIAGLKTKESIELDDVIETIDNDLKYVFSNFKIIREVPALSTLALTYNVKIIQGTLIDETPELEYVGKDDDGNPIYDRTTTNNGYEFYDDDEIENTECEDKITIGEALKYYLEGVERTNLAY